VGAPFLRVLLAQGWDRITLISQMFVILSEVEVSAVAFLTLVSSAARHVLEGPVVYKNIYK
jgi:hypothetical protein